jgi:hypothetical protein
MKTERIITTENLVEARAKLRDSGVAEAMARLSDVEPDLFGFITASINCVAGRLSLADTPNAAVRDTAEEMLELVLTCLIAERQLHRTFE